MIEARKVLSVLDMANKADLVDGKVPAEQLPSYVDDVVEYADVEHFPAEGESSKIYVALDTGYTYRWSGSDYIQIGGQDLSVLAANFADQYDETAMYAAGALCIYEDALYVANDDIEIAEPWTPAHWSRTNLADVVDALRAVMEVELATKQDELVSGENIKTVAGKSMLGSGNLEVTKSDVGLGNINNTSDADKPVSTAQQAALDLKLNVADYVVDDEISDVSENPIQNKVIKAALDEKQDELVSGVNIKTVNSGSLLGSGDIIVKAFEDFPSSWSSYSGTTQGLCAYIAQDPSLLKGKCYLGALQQSRISDLPLHNGEVRVLVVGGAIANWVLHLTLTSGDHSPYHWECTWWPSGWSGWIGFQPELISGTNIKTIEGRSLLGSGNIDLTKSDVGLGNVDNTSDLNKPISTAQQNALDLKLDKSSFMTDQEIADAIDMAFIDPILENNSWAKIRKVCEAGLASNYWHVGDTKMVTGGDGYTRPVMIVDMQGLYGKHIVFQFRATSKNTFVWEADNANNYSTSDMVLTHLAAGGDAYLAMVGTGDLASQLTNTTVKVAKGGDNGTLVDVTGKLFLPAMKEITAFTQYSRSEEDKALSTFQYYVGHNQASDRSLGGYWWLRSPNSGNTASVCCIVSYGNLGSDNASNRVRIAPCFAF